MRIMKKRMLFAFAVLLVAGAALAQEGAFGTLPRVLGRGPGREIVALNSSWIDGVSDQTVFACACPSLVSFCKEWAQKWAPEPRHANDARQCVIEGMLAVESDAYRADKLGLTWEEYQAMPEDELFSMIATRLGITVEEYRTLPNAEIDQLAKERGL